MAKASIIQNCMVMEITEVSKLDMICSPEILIHGIPWKVKVCKKGQGDQQSLCVYSHCYNEDKSPDWSLWGTASFKLLPANEKDDRNAIEHHNEPYIFDNSGLGHGTGSLIKWNDLFNQDKKYVKDDTINLEIKINAENPNDPNRSRLHFKCVDKYCETCSCAKFQLKVTNASYFMAVKSPNFTLCGLPWNIQLCKTRSSHLGAFLRLKEDPKKELSKITLCVKVLSSNEKVHPIEQCITKQFKYLFGDTMRIVSWDEMVKPESGFVKDDIITLEVQIKPVANNEPIAKRAKLNPANETKSPQMECPICLKCIADQELAVTPCGHMFCFECIKNAIANRAVCPSCNKAARLNTLRRLYLPV